MLRLVSLQVCIFTKMQELEEKPKLANSVAVRIEIKNKIDKIQQ